MAKPVQSKTNAGKNATASPRTGRKPLPHARRGSVTKPVRNTPWSLIITGSLVVAAIVAVVAIVIVSNLTRPKYENPPAPLTAPAIGVAAPDFSAKARDGSKITKADIAGSPTLIVFFASWCPHCQAEAPKLKALAEANPDLKMVFLGVGYKDTQKDIWDFQSKYSLSVPTYDDGGKAASVYGISAYPTLVSIDKNGIIRDRDSGEATQERLNTFVAKARGQ